MSTFKIHFSPRNIRKVTLPEQVTFESFKSFISEQYNHVIQSRDIQVQYRDEDQDIITVSSQLEWEEMLRGQERYVVFVREVNQGGTQVTLRQILEGLGGFGQRGEGWNGRRGGCPRREGCPRRGFHEGVVRQKAFWCHQKALELMGDGSEESLVHARELLLKVLSFAPADAVALYNLACVDSLMGNIEQAVVNLKRAIALGYTNVEHMIQDPDFENIRHTEGFDECVHFLTGDQVETKEPEENSPKAEQAETLEEEIPEPKLPEPEQEPSEPISSEQEAADIPIKTILSSMGIHINDSLLEELTERFSSDPTQIINHYFRSLY